ncbi:L-aspartate oxidase [Halobacillus andaensis]|uniref:L-aspartate oxidase n=1 Tax=Halobacillus andaensis TaxID=1176239 RepID=A0A917F0F2_HALAA|nr:L-aspartate oxidase [Halobacillus andaensis]MBP2005283.1 L-aspartate oxidase [Halobacillus andaensis]GGF30290.1 L-aspartate oxidase [Halobacillus andaensis]
MRKNDVIIVGSGVAALQLAVHLPRHLNVMVITKSSVKNNNSSLAQGGIAAAIGPKDHPYLHYVDTIEAGRQINDHGSVYHLTEEAPKVIQELRTFHCKFDTYVNNELQLGKEGAHSLARIVHGGGDQTGASIVDCLLNKIGSNICVVENELVYDLLVNEEGQCCGVKTFDKNEEVHTFTAPHVVLATGGCGELYRFTSNSIQATGEGIALAYWAGAQVKDMEFMQFHPTLLFTNGKTRGLITEAVRGEGARLVDGAGNYLMDGVHPMGDLAPRHIVAQTIFHSLKNDQPVYLDLTSIPNFEKRFPTVAKLCRKYHFTDKVPVAPGSHFLMGGIETDQQGKTSIPGLYVIGEAACTGVHGANRLASNSLLEGLVYGKRLAHYIKNQKREINIKLVPKHKPQVNLSSHRLPKIKEIQDQMMENVGIVRHKKSLQKQLSWIESFKLDQWLRMDFAKLSKKQWTTIAMLQTSFLIARAALERTESRGGHYRSDYPFESEKWLKKHTVQCRKEVRGIYEPAKS